MTIKEILKQYVFVAGLDNYVNFSNIRDPENIELLDPEDFEEGGSLEEYADYTQEDFENAFGITLMVRL